MSGDATYYSPKRHKMAKIRVHDYLYDSAFIVSGARDYARTAFRAAMESAQVIIQPMFTTMFSECRPSIRVAYHPNCRLPDHIDRSYEAYLNRVQSSNNIPTPQLSGKDRFKFTAVPRRVMAIPSATPDFHPTTPTGVHTRPTKPRNRGTQSLFRESSAQTIPWQPDGVASRKCEKTPEVMYLDRLEWGPGNPYRSGDLPADFHTTAIINKMRHTRSWIELVERGKYPRWLKKRDDIISELEIKDWIFREAEIDELQGIRLELLKRLDSEQREKQTNRTSQKLAKLWAHKKQEMGRKIDDIRKTRDRELRKLVALHESGGRAGLVAQLKSARGMGSMTAACNDPTSELHAPLARHGYQARRRHAEIIYDPTLLSLEDHMELGEPPPWLETCGQNLKKTCSGHHIARDPNTLCERETKWSEQFLEVLHSNLKKARIGAANTSAGPLHVLKPRKESVTERPATPEVQAVDDFDEYAHQAALVLQRIIRGRAVQNLMYEGRTRAAELTEELKTTHGLQKEDKARISREEAKAREFNARRAETEQKEDAITALVDELCGSAVSAALDFLEKELQRLKEERRQHAFLLIALREKTMREAAEAGRRQKEMHRLREHDEIFKQVLGITQGTEDTYLKEVIDEGVELAAEIDAVARAKAQADKYEDELLHKSTICTADTNELVAELVHQFLLPHAHKTATRHHIAMVQKAKLVSARNTIFGLIDDAKIKKDFCASCGGELDDSCRCRFCPLKMTPTETPYRDDKRWKYTRSRPEPSKKTFAERIPLHHEIRCMLSDLVSDVVDKSKHDRAKSAKTRREIREIMDEKMEITLDVKYMLDTAVDLATGAKTLPVKEAKYQHIMRRVIYDALERSEPPKRHICPKELPSELRRQAEEKAALEIHDHICRCDDETSGHERPVDPGTVAFDDDDKLLPSELRLLEELRRCKCDSDPTGHGENEHEDPEDSLTGCTEGTDWTMTYTEEGQESEEEN